MKDAVVRAALADEGGESVVARDALAQHIGARQHAVGAHALLEQGEDAAFLRHGHGDAVEEVVHADRVELVLEGQRCEDVGDDGDGVGSPGAELGDGEGARFAVDEGEARGGGHAGRVEVVACADAHVEVVAAHVGTKEGQQVGGGGTAPGVAVDEAEDPEVIDGKAPRGIEFLGLFVDDFGDGGRVAGFGDADGTVGDGRGGDDRSGSGCHVQCCALEFLFKKKWCEAIYVCAYVCEAGTRVSSTEAACAPVGWVREEMSW